MFDHWTGAACPAPGFAALTAHAASPRPMPNHRDKADAGRDGNDEAGPDFQRRRLVTRQQKPGDSVLMKQEFVDAVEPVQNRQQREEV